MQTSSTNVYKCPRCNYTGNKTSMTKHYNRKVTCNDINSFGNKTLELIPEVQSNVKSQIEPQVQSNVQPQIEPQIEPQVQSNVQLNEINRELREIRELITQVKTIVEQKNFKVIIEEPPQINRTGYKYTTPTPTYTS
jgi:hypothetical protein